MSSFEVEGGTFTGTVLQVFPVPRLRNVSMGGVVAKPALQQPDGELGAGHHGIAVHVVCKFPPTPPVVPLAQVGMSAQVDPCVWVLEDLIVRKRPTASAGSTWARVSHARMSQASGMSLLAASQSFA
jgi:hypothetical protein